MSRLYLNCHCILIRITSKFGYPGCVRVLRSSFKQKLRYCLKTDHDRFYTLSNSLFK